MNVPQDILLCAASLTLGETGRFLCPRCEGGSQREKSLSITLAEDGQLFWQCFRTKCPGHRGTSVISTDGIEKAVKKNKPVFTGHVEPIPPPVLAWIAHHWGIHDPEHWYWTQEYGGRIAMSIRSPKFTHRGWLLRSINPNSRSKALTYTNNNEEGLSWYKTSPYAPTVLVEDIPSSVRASTYMNAVALLGTGVGLSRAVEIAEYATRPIYIALDQDATALAFKWARKWGLMWDDVKVLPLEKDLKNMNEEELKELLT